MNRQRSTTSRHAFTLAEMMTVVGIIVLALAMAVPVINTLTGNRSVEAGYNRLAGVLGHARQLAVFNRRVCGIFTFINPNTQSQDIVYVYQTNPGSSVVNLDIMQSDLDAAVGSTATTEEQVSLPPGLAMDVIASTSGGASDRYLGFGPILFDTSGQLHICQYSVLKASRLGTWLRLVNDLVIASPTPPLYSAQAINMYDRAAYKAQVLNSGVNAGINYCDVPLTNGYSSYFTAANPFIYSGVVINATDKPQEESWLDAHGSIMVVKPNDGSLLRND